MQVDLGRRAAGALNLLFPGPHQGKRIARAFGCSLRQAKYLLAGRHWTLARIMQASELLGDAWEAAFSRLTTGRQHNFEMTDIDARLAWLEQKLAEIDRREAARLASTTGTGGAGDE